MAKFKTIEWDSQNRPSKIETSEGVEIVTDWYPNGEPKDSKPAADLPGFAKPEEPKSYPRRLLDAANPISQAKGLIEAVKNPSPEMAGPIAGGLGAVYVGAPAIAASGPFAPLTTAVLGGLGAVAGSRFNDVVAGRGHGLDQFGEVAQQSGEEFGINMAGSLPWLGLGAANRGRVAAAPKLRKYAEGKAVDSLQMTAKQREIANAKNPNLGRTLLDEGAIPRLGTPNRIQGRVEKLKETAGEKVGSIIDSADEKLSITPEPKPVLVPVGSGLKGDLQPGRAANPATFRTVMAEAPKATNKVVDTIALADDLVGEVDRLSKIPGMEGATAKLGTFLDTLRNNKTLTLREAHELRRNIDKSINFNKRVPEMAGSEQALHDIRTAISERMTEVIDALEGVGELKKANRTFGDLAKASDALDRSTARLSNNRDLSLTDTIAATAGMGVDGGIGLKALAAAALAGANKFGRTFGDSLRARGADALAGRPKQLPYTLQGLAEQVSQTAPFTEPVALRMPIARKAPSR